ncbi:hypothetical protein [Micromonospora coxensis]|uniref:hypothetical protein n=1 Tax=Micromonospora coxensis TaxID=356852 RepID=UPI00342540FC
MLDWAGGRAYEAGLTWLRLDPEVDVHDGGNAVGLLELRVGAPDPFPDPGR